MKPDYSHDREKQKAHKFLKEIMGSTPPAHGAPGDIVMEIKLASPSKS